MKEIRYNLRLSKKEKDALATYAKQNGISIINYIKQRLFESNSDILEEETSYEVPAKEKHSYFTARMLQDIYMVLLHMLGESKSAEETLKIKKYCRSYAEQNIAQLGYLKFETKPRDEE